MAFDVPTTRGAYSSLSDGWTYLNGSERAQVPERVLSAMTTAFRTAPKSLAGEAGTGAHSRARQAGVPAAAEFEADARRAFADVAGCSVSGVVLGPSKEALVSALAHAMSLKLIMGENLVLSRTGSQVVNVPFRRAASMFGAAVRVAEADLTTGALPGWQFESLVDAHTRLVVVPAADPFVGTIAPVREIADITHARSHAWVLVDASDAAPSRLIDMHKFGADILLLDAAAWGGPEVSALLFRDASNLNRLRSQSLNPRAQGVKRLETSPVAPALLGGVAESVQHLATLDRSARGTRRRRIETSMPQVSRYLEQLTERLITSLSNLSSVYVVGIDSEGADDLDTEGLRRIPRVSFLVEGVPAATVVGRLLNNGLVTSAIDSVQSPLLDAMGVEETEGAVCVGLQPFNTPHDVDQLVRVVASLG